MASLNQVNLIGNLGAAPELRSTGTGKSVCSFRVAVKDTWGSGNDRQESTTWVSVVAWDKLGEACETYLRKGSLCFVQGRLVTRSYDNKDGVKVNVTEVVATAVQFLDPQRHGHEPAQTKVPVKQEPKQQQRRYDPNEDSNVPF